MTNQSNSQASASFLGTRGHLLAILLWGYFMMLITFGMYRFWLVTNKRRFYWNHTQIHGESLEYTGTPVQLLVGFLMALVVFLPLYGFFFYLSTRASQTAVLGYAGAIFFLFFLSGYAAYRGRRFLLSRTLWRGIRFSQGGNALNYAFRRIFWILLTLVTLGLAYPFMVASLYKYRIEHTWYGDRQCRFEGSWKSIAGPFYFFYFLIAGLSISGLYYLSKLGEGRQLTMENVVATPLPFALLGAAAFILLVAYFFLRARIISRMFSAIAIGRAHLVVRVRAWSLFWQQFAYGFFLAIFSFGFLILLGYVMGDVLEPLMQDKQRSVGDVLKLGWYNLVIFGSIYLSFMATISILAQLVFGLGFWRLVARGALIENETDLHTIRARGEESALVGEGLADALNVGAY